MAIQTLNASIDMLSVTIKTLHVNNKMVTLSVFRQLPQWEIYKNDGTMRNGFELWGIVRYAIKDQGNLWIVISKDSILYRCVAFSELPSVYIAKKLLEQAESEKLKFSNYHYSGYTNQRGNYRAHKVFHTKEDFDKHLWFLQIQLEQSQNAEKTYEKIMKLPQLFIAV